MVMHLGSELRTIFKAALLLEDLENQENGKAITPTPKKQDREKTIKEQLALEDDRILEIKRGYTSQKM